MNTCILALCILKRKINTRVQFQLAHIHVCMVSALTLRRATQVLCFMSTKVYKLYIHTFTCRSLYIFPPNLWNFGTRSLMEGTPDLIRSILSSQGTGDCLATLLNPNLFWCTQFNSRNTDSWFLIIFKNVRMFLNR